MRSIRSIFGLLACISALASTSTSLAADVVKVGMLKPNVVSVIYWVAQKTGAFERNGIVVEEHPFPSGQTIAGIEQMMRGNIDFYIGASSEVVHANDQSLRIGKEAPLAIVEAGDPGDSWIVLRPDLAIQTLEQLKTQPLRIGVSNPGSSHLTLFRAYLRSKGMVIEDLKWRFLPLQAPNMLPALVGGQLDGFMHDGLTTTMALNAKAGAVFMHARRGDMGGPGKLYPSEVVSANRAFIKAHPDVAKRFVKALNDASDTYAKSPRPAMVAIVADWTHQDAAVVDALYDRVDPRVGLDKVSAQAWWDLFGAAMKARKEIAETMRFEDVFDLSLRPQ